MAESSSTLGGLVDASLKSLPESSKCPPLSTPVFLPVKWRLCLSDGLVSREESTGRRDGCRAQRTAAGPGHPGHRSPHVSVDPEQGPKGSNPRVTPKAGKPVALFPTVLSNVASEHSFTVALAIFQIRPQNSYFD